jgi:hypothetical protein
LLTGIELIITFVIVFFGSVTAGTVAFGMGLVIAPILLLFLPPQTAVVLVKTLSAVVLLMVLIHARKNIRLHIIKWMVLGGLLAVPFGVFILSYGDPGVLKIIIAVLVLALAILTFFEVSLPFANRKHTGLMVGFLTSMTTTAFSVGGPLAVLYIIDQKGDDDMVRANLALYFFVTHIFALSLYLIVGIIDIALGQNVMIYLPIALAGFLCAIFIKKLINKNTFRLVAIVISILGSISILFNELFL